jgi:hypothetical protein
MPPEPTHPAFPPPGYENQVNKATMYRILDSGLVLKIFNALPSAVKTMISGGNDIMIYRLTVTSLCDLLRQHLCAHPEAVILQARDNLKLPLNLTSPTPMLSLTTGHSAAHKLLADQNMPMYEHDKIDSLQTAVQKSSSIFNAAMSTYCITTPRAVQTYAGLAAVLLSAERYQQTQGTSSSTGYAPTVAGAVIQPPPPPTARPRRGTAGPQRHFQPSAETKYCFFHGYNNSHWGEQRGAVKGCDLGSHMTAAQRAANKHTDVPNGSTKNAPA